MILKKYLSIFSLTNKDDVLAEDMTETQIKAANDRPILRAAIKAKADVLLTGDKNFLKSGIKNPEIMTPFCLIPR